MSCCKETHKTKHNQECVECGIPLFARNHYFNGKLLVERDFSDEQRFFLGKHRRHNQLLHGWGVVCGLKVKRHPNPDCRAQWVIIEPGYAIDCCGREIFVQTQQMFDFRTRFREVWKEQNGKDAEPDDKPHPIQICVRYKECPTESVPSIFDDCGCDDTSCQPNRILESYEFDVLLLDPSKPPAEKQRVDVVWDHNLAVPDARRVAFDSVNKRTFVSDGGAAGKIFALHAPAQNQTLAERILDLTVAVDGSRLYAAVLTGGGADVEIRVYDASDLTKPLIQTLNIAGGGGGLVRLAPEEGGRIWASSEKLTNVTIFDSAGALVDTKNVGAAPVDIAIAAGGHYAYIANSGGASVTAIKLADLTDINTMPVGAGAAPKPVAIAASLQLDGENILVVDKDNSTVYQIGWRPARALPADRIVSLGSVSAGFGGRPLDVVVTAGGDYAFLLERVDADGKGLVQALALRRLEAGAPGVLGVAVAAGVEPKNIAIAATDDELVVAAPDVDPGTNGAVLFFHIKGTQCEDLLDPGECDICETGNCIVLATFKNYTFDKPIDDPDIDNKTGRKVLLSTSAITEVLRCVIENGGLKGKDGKDGKDGKNGEDGHDGHDGLPGKDALLLDLPGIVHINWPHNGTLAPDSVEFGRLMEEGLLVFFTPKKPVVAETLTENSVRLLRRMRQRPRDVPLEINCWCEIAITVEANESRAECGNAIRIDPDTINTGSATAVRIRARPPEATRNLPPGDYRVVIEGDHIAGVNQIDVPDPNDLTKTIKVHAALDADHLAPGLLNPGSVPIGGLPRRCPTGNGTEGGTFESWFTIGQRG